MPRKTYRKAVVKLADLVAVDGILDGLTFEGCQINGPAVLVLQDSTLERNTLGGPNLDAVLWEVPPTRPIIIGAILARNCVFKECTFANVGFAGTPDFIRMMRRGTSAS